MRISRSLVAVVVGAALVVAASAWAASIHGSARADLLRGTAHADTINGLGGNDRIYGLGGNDKLYGGPGGDRLYGGPGNDTLVGGPGADVLDCGPGIDTAIADSSDTVQANCEIVKGLPAPPPPPPPAPPPTTTTTTPNLAKTGTYCGFTDAGGGICFDINGPPPLSMINLKLQIGVEGNECDPPHTGTITYQPTGFATPLTANNQFTFVVRGGPASGTTVTGQLDTAGNATGTIHFTSHVNWSDGTTPYCQVDTNWSAKLQ